MRYFKLLLLFLLIAFIHVCVLAQDKSDNSEVYTCVQPKKEKLKVIKKADSEPFRVRRIEFVGNTYARDIDIRKGLEFEEGDIFTKKNLKKTLKKLSNLDYIYPVRLKDMDVKLAKNDKNIYFIFCVKDGPKK